MPSKNKLAREQREAERASILFLMYYWMGPERSLPKLREVCATVGLKLCINTYKRYSVKYEWQRQLLEKEVAEREEREKEILAQVDAMNDEHIKVHRGLMGMAVAGINFYQDQLERKKAAGQRATLNLSPRDIVRLAHQAQLGERLARGQATSRSEVMVEVIGTFVQEFAMIFKTVNVIVNAEEREREYIRLFDERLREYYSQITEPAIRQIRSGYRG